MGGAVDDVNLLSGTQELRLQAHKGKARPEEGAVAASILTAVYHISWPPGQIDGPSVAPSSAQTDIFGVIQLPSISNVHQTSSETQSPYRAFHDKSLYKPAECEQSVAF